MKKPLIYSLISIAALAGVFFAYQSASAQDYGDYSYGGDFGSYGGDFGSYGDYGFGGYGGSSSGYGSYDNGCGAGGCGGYSSGGYDSSCGSYGCGSSYGGYGGSSSYGCGSYCGGGYSGFVLSFGSYGGYGGSSSSYYAPQTITNRYNYTNTVANSYNTNTNTNTNINTNGGGYALPPVYIPPVYIPQPPTYYPPTVYTPPPIYYPPPIVCSIAFSNFNPSPTAQEGRWYSYNLQAVSTQGGQITYRLVNGPDGLTVSSNGQISWTPAFNQGRGSAYEVRVAAYNGGCETNRTFYIQVEDMNPVPPPAPVPPKPACTCACNPCPVVKPACPTVCGTVQPKPIDVGVCPPTVASAAPIVGATVVEAAPTVSSGGFWDSLGIAIAGFGAALSALLYSPWLLFLVIVILIVLLFRAYQRTRMTQITI